MDDVFQGALTLFMAGACVLSCRAVMKGLGSEIRSKNSNSSCCSSPAMKKGMTVTMLPHMHEEKMEKRMRTNSSANDHDECIERNRVVVRVPATSANLGPGYDTIGMAIDMWNEFTVERADKFEMVCEGEGSLEMPLDDTNLVCVGIRAAFKVANVPEPVLKYKLMNRIPYARGLGSSSAAIVGGLIAGLVLAGHKVPTWGSEELLQMACAIEGHPDNVAPAIYGGIQLGIFDETSERWATERVNLPPGIQCVCFIPCTIGKTSTARGVLPDKVSRKEAVYNIGRVAWLINALSTNNLDQLRLGCMDALHQPQRSDAVYPHLTPLIAAAVEAGACTAYLSGAGPTVMALTSGASGDIFTQRDKERVDRAVAKAMIQAAAKTHTEGEVFITKASEVGACVVSADPPFSKGLVQYNGI